VNAIKSASERCSPANEISGRCTPNSTCAPSAREPTPATPETSLAFRFVSGHRALDVVSTLGDRHRKPVERLGEPADLDRWLAASGLTMHERATAHDLAHARTLRETINQLAQAVVAGDQPGATDVDALNRSALRPPLAPQLDGGLKRGASRLTSHTTTAPQRVTD
jgi:predicted RNA-binding Zn ribbon-like protein